MKKTDLSIHNICLASIKRHTFKDVQPKWTRIYSTLDEFNAVSKTLDLKLIEKEIPICSVTIDRNNWSVLTTQRIITRIDDKVSNGYIGLASYKLFGNFKGYGNEDYTMGELEFPNQANMKYFIETGKPSMIMVYGVRTRIQIEPRNV